MKPRPTYRSLDMDSSCQHPIDEPVHGPGSPWKSGTEPSASGAVRPRPARQETPALFDYEQALGRVTSRRDAAYFDLGVEYEIATARVHGLGAPSKAEREAIHATLEAFILL